MKRRNVKGVRAAAAVLVLLACATFSRACPCTGDDAPCACGPACGCVAAPGPCGEGWAAAPDARGCYLCLRGNRAGWSFRPNPDDPGNGWWYPPLPPPRLIFSVAGCST